MYGRQRPVALASGDNDRDHDDGSREHAVGTTTTNTRRDSLSVDVRSTDPSAAMSIAHTVVSTIAEGLVHTVSHWRVLLLGQGVAVVLAVAGGTNEVLSMECGVSAPSTYNAFGYSVIALFGGFMHQRDTKNSRRNITSEERESFRNHDDDMNQEVDDADDDEGGDDDDDLTLEDESPVKRSIFSRNNGPAHGKKRPDLRSSIKSHGSDSKTRLQYPFLFGMFTIHAKWYYYFAVALIEAQAYYFIFLAFRYTSFTFVYVSDALAIPSAMIFTRLIMKRSYQWTHLIGGAICIAGIVVNTASDMSLEDGLEHAASLAHIKGDLFAILGAVLLGLDDVLSEIIVSDFGGVVEMLFMKGLFGALISIVQLSILERDEVRTLFSPEASSGCEFSLRMALFSAHIVTRALDVWGEMQFLFLSEAALLNLLLLTSDLYAAVFDILTIGLTLTPYFYFAFFLIFCGIVLYEAGESPMEQHPPCTPMDIEIRQRHRKNAGSVTCSTATEDTVHAGNLGKKSEIELT